MKIVALYGSSRESGNSEQLADYALDGLQATKIYLRHKKILPVADGRHSPEGFHPVDDDYESIITQVINHDVIFFITPLYWYGMSGLMKNFIDRWSQSLRNTNYDFKGSMKDKQAFVIVTGGDSINVKGLPLIQQFQLIFDFMSMKFGGYILGVGNKPGEVMNDQHALHQARLLNQQLQAVQS
ncbi:MULTISPECIES: flavodoxin family protein [unclassified Thermoactinomyces]|uniref:flavodoxin family protein n=1 Tax=unclassified Thermoactinomyces TaxID=2634588 RepID=UPI0018DCF1DF|nr:MULTISPECIES: flavodoxin family protein [unclassified Thermoactinomyces]MBH8597653.1 flavodoxin family protein [Thermoactinomyces sp. CICC 10523]MBH8603994.1 flavodoxin family protein [Thermoactinomyces sp. CICC 10522]MBH8606472.1 flavodoxin family protein [Thermoactinomyces sp. CICC 10521]